MRKPTKRLAAEVAIGSALLLTGCSSTDATASRESIAPIETSACNLFTPELARRLMSDFTPGDDEVSGLCSYTERYTRTPIMAAVFEFSGSTVDFASRLRQESSNVLEDCEETASDLYESGARTVVTYSCGSSGSTVSVITTNGSRAFYMSALANVDDSELVGVLLDISKK